MKRFVLGTRGSDLAVAQALLAEKAIQAVDPVMATERMIIRTTGDMRVDAILAKPGELDKGLFTRELEEALLGGAIDAAVHSLKDLPTELPPGLALAAVLERAPSGDLLVSKFPGGLEGVPKGATIATGSLRRQCLLKWLRPDLHVAAIRGNVPTRIRKLRDSNILAGVILAEAGIGRLEACGRLDPLDGLEASLLTEFLPAPGQGAIGLEARQHDSAALSILSAVNHPGTWESVAIERAVLRHLGGGCHMPLGIHVIAGQSAFEVRAILFKDLGFPPRRAEFSIARNETEKVAKEAVIRLAES